MKVTMQSELTAKEIGAMCGGRLCGDGDVKIRGFCTDSREADADTAFVALRGERVNGHDYIGAACARGCRLVICERLSEGADAAQLAVPDSEVALSQLAAAHMQTLSCKTVAVTGSVGKTTTKEMIASVLSTHAQIYRSEGNHNSVIGMPLSVMEIGAPHEYAVLEMGMSGFGEIERMSRCARPDIAVVTNIGTSHMEMLGSRENIRRAKLEILCGLKNGGVLLLNGDEPLLRNVSGKTYRTVDVSLSCENAALFAQNIRVEADGTHFEAVWDGCTHRDLHIRVQGRHNVYAALFAFAVGMLSGLSAGEIRRGLLNFTPGAMRQNVYGYHGMTVIEDCYNASPESMRAAIDVLVGCAQRAGGRSIAVLGDMLELGDASDGLHRAVGAYIVESGVDCLLVLGHGGEQIACGAADAGMARDCIHINTDTDNIAHSADALIGLCRERDTVLFKASRSIRMERVLEYWKLHH
ncbi:MAG: UDP-N-acetylmuramoyl-tripeptide--D-alanyl-D-alanine ligase [Clostridia bacterium]|nr:UDP-N-acetylmuramoyl-tripeptide--D-alanyl-D-alanine ligase [Clostridia bacterium]